MDIGTRQASVSELRSKNDRLTWTTLAMSVVIAALAIKLVFQSEVVIERTAGMPSGSVIQKSAWDKKAELATLLDVTGAIANINPSNAEYQKQLLAVFLSPQEYTRISTQIDQLAKKLSEQRELGSYYFIWKAYDYDQAIDRFFIRGDVHTVNAAKDTAEAWVFEYQTHVENYRLVVDKVSSYRGEHAHDSAWLKEQKK
jgi:TraE protein